MDENTIPSQLGPMTIPATLSPVNTSKHEPAAPARVSPAFKWLMVAVAAALLLYLAR